ncbi:DUF6268 family outer membrane beta-barrel protein [Adhaeribacter soli]|uniref:DUF6268 domain-containing protein n=1 Tax=Adhaeribacter soli TaxID=2607655 RepID=A0A5N1IMH4_9BACT|nr:DUF6268 family outer membrane beta-barrel protein [Adhaeribacter soli]KAA9325001.1 hypothetical protein F0P94_19005 [Adhaeribacter soli]
MKQFLSFLIFLVCVSGFSASAQEDSTRRDKEYANPSVEGMPRGRFFLLRYNRTFNYDFNARQDQLKVGDRDATIKHSNIAEIKGYVPLWNRPHLKIVLGVGYEREEFNFKENTGYTTDYAYFRNLQDKGLKSLSAQLAVVRPVNYRNYWILRVKGQLNGDYTSSELNFSDYLRTTAEAIYGWKINKDFSWGVGAQLGYQFGRKTIYPAVLYNRTFNDRWGLEAVFPAAAVMRYNKSDKTLFYAGYNLDGFSYIIKVDKPPFSSDPAFANLKTIELRHNDLRLKLRWEQEIYDFIWFSLEGGLRYNIAYDAFEQGSKRDVTLIESEVGTAPFAQAEIYFVVPRVFLKR